MGLILVSKDINLQTQMQKLRALGLTPDDIANRVVGYHPPAPPAAAPALKKTGRMHPNTKIALGAGAVGAAGAYGAVRFSHRKRKEDS